MMAALDQQQQQPNHPFFVPAGNRGDEELERKFEEWLKVSCFFVVVWLL